MRARQHVGCEQQPPGEAVGRIRVAMSGRSGAQDEDVDGVLMNDAEIGFSEKGQTAQGGLALVVPYVGDNFLRRPSEPIHPQRAPLRMFVME